MGKKNISVTAKFSDNGAVTPISLHWEDGRTFDIDCVLDTRKAASLKAGGIGVRFICRIREKQFNLFKDEDLWFMEVDD